MSVGSATPSGVIRVGGDSVIQPFGSPHRHGDISLLIVGHCLLDRAQRDVAFASAVSDGDLARVAAWPGAYSAIIIRDRAVTAYADVSEQFPLYYSRRGEEILVAWDAAALAVAHDRGIDPLTAAAEIACPSVLPAWQTRSPYTGVSRVPGGAVLHAAPGSVRVWHERVPYPVTGRSLADGAALLRDALLDAVRERCTGRQVSADFSGGLDSTSVALLAASCARSPVTAVVYHQPLAPAGDLPYAIRYAALEPNLSLRVVTGTEHTLPFAGLADHGGIGSGENHGTDPHPGWLAAERSHARLAAAQRSGATLHLTGEGGDAILLPAPSYLGSLVRHGRPLTLLRHSSGYARLRQAATADLVGQAVRLAATGPGRALSSLASELNGAGRRAGRWMDFIAWWPPAGPAAQWLTAGIRRQLADHVADPATARALPEGTSPPGLAALTDVRRSGDAQRQLRRLAAPLGLEVHAPFLDDAVIRAALSVPAHVRADPRAYKPLLGATLDGLLPAEVLTRRTKGNYTAEDYAGVRAALPALRILLRDSRLADLGVIEPAAVLAAVDRMATGVTVPLGPLNTVLATEVWLHGTDWRHGPQESRVEVTLG
jgi:asparagine synthase (glutamine-hydrolysing)